MVVGNGMIATRFASYKEDENFLIFASGVSNSKSKDDAKYKREFDLLRKTLDENKGKHLVYFSTCSVYDPDEMQSKYVRHKLEIEEYIRLNATGFNIFRVSNVVGKSGNPNTVLNYFYHHVKNNINFDIWKNAGRNLIDMDDVFTIADHILQHGFFKNETVNIANSLSYKVPEIVAAIEAHLNVRADYSVIEKGTGFSIDVSKTKEIVKRLGIDFSDDYLKKLLIKNY